MIYELDNITQFYSKQTCAYIFDVFFYTSTKGRGYVFYFTLPVCVSVFVCVFCMYVCLSVCLSVNKIPAERMYLF